MNSMNGGSRWQWIAGTCLAARMSFMATLGPHTPLPPLPPTYAHPLKLHYHTSVHSLKLCVEKSQEIIRKKCWKQASTTSPVFSQYLQSNRDGWPTFGKDFPFCLICVIGPHLIHIMVMWKVNYLVFHHSRLSGCYELARNHTNSLLWKTLKLCARWRGWVWGSEMPIDICLGLFSNQQPFFRHSTLTRPCCHTSINTSTFSHHTVKVTNYVN